MTDPLDLLAGIRADRTLHVLLLTDEPATAESERRTRP